MFVKRLKFQIYHQDMAALVAVAVLEGVTPSSESRTMTFSRFHDSGSNISSSSLLHLDTFIIGVSLLGVS